MLASDPPGAAAVGAARAEVERYLHGLDATGAAVDARRRRQRPCAQAHRQAAASERAELDEALLELADDPNGRDRRRYGIGEERARTLPAGAVILAGIQSLLGTPLRVQRGGLREGALLSLAAENAVAA